MNTDFYKLTATTIDNKLFDFANLRNKVVLIVNTASKCGFTPQYAELEQLHEKFKDNGLIILGFPCGQFGNQELKLNNDIAQFCTRNYGVTFQMMEKIDVNGINTHPVYQYLKAKASGILGTKNIKWNFTKFLINHDATVIVRYGSLVKPSKLTIGIESLLEEIPNR